MTRAMRTLLVLTFLGFVPVPAAADTIVPGSLTAVEGNLATMDTRSISSTLG